MKGKDQSWTESDVSNRWSGWIGCDSLKINCIEGKKIPTKQNELRVIASTVKSGYYLLVGLWELEATECKAFSSRLTLNICLKYHTCYCCCCYCCFYCWWCCSCCSQNMLPSFFPPSLYPQRPFMQSSFHHQVNSYSSFKWHCLH